MVLRKLGPYNIGEPLGSGGMGTVYRGIEDGTNREVAIKVLSPTLVSDPGFRDRFESEIKSLEQLVHPNIVELYGFGEHDGQLFYAMELVEGSNLQEEIAAGRRFTWREIIEFGEQICGALKHAHDHGIIHRDIKPANLVIDQDDRIQLTDFGIAKLFGDTSQTVDGGILGTADYMAPEQAEGLSVTPRSDIYSLGAALYALLAGRPPFQGKSLPEVVHKVRFEPPLPVRRFAPETPEELEEILDSLLSKDPKRRIPTPLALSKRLVMIRESLSLDPALANKTLTDTDEFEPPQVFSEEKLAAMETAIVQPEIFEENPTEHASVSILESDQPSVEPSPNRYTAVDQDYRKRLQLDESEESLVETIAKWLGLIGVIACLATAAWYFTREPSADELYATIEASAQNGDEQLLAARDEMKTFLGTFPNDERSQQILDWQSEAVVAQQSLRLESLSLLPIGQGGRDTVITPKGISAIEWQLIEAIRNERWSPVKGLRQLKAIVAMFDNHTELDEKDQLCLQVAKRRLVGLTAPTNTISREKQQELIAARIETAEKLIDDDPAAANVILQAIVDFYSEEPWAAPYVEQAREAMTEKATTNLRTDNQHTETAG